MRGQGKNNDVFLAKMHKMRIEKKTNDKLKDDLHSPFSS